MNNDVKLLLKEAKVGDIFCSQRKILGAGALV